MGEKSTGLIDSPKPDLMYERLPKSALVKTRSARGYVPAHRVDHANAQACPNCFFAGSRERGEPPRNMNRWVCRYDHLDRS